MKLEVTQQTYETLNKLKRMVNKEDLIFLNPETLEIVEQVDLTNLEDATITSASLVDNEDGTLSWVDFEEDRKLSEGNK
jgi:hypothetical protein|tara:strand:+ start:6809 stop:7045 length:237 start_codon:yes stop_codon:yes gene_type:complete